MTTEELRASLIQRIDSILARPFLVWGDDRKILSAVRGFASTMTTADLERLQHFYARNKENVMPQDKKSHTPDQTEADCCCECIGHLAQAFACCHAHSQCTTGPRKVCCDDCCNLIFDALEKCVATLKECCA